MEAGMDQATLAIDKARGRKDSTWQTQVVKMKVVVDRIADLVSLHVKATAAKDKLADAIKAVAESAGLNASSVSKFVAARASDNFEERAEKVAQLALVFEEVGAVSGSRGGTD